MMESVVFVCVSVVCTLSAEPERAERAGLTTVVVRSIVL